MGQGQQTPTPESVLPPETTYPPAPWQAHGQAWVGLFHADVPAILPYGLAPLLGARWRCVALVRYQSGSTLTYDELIVGRFARVGLRCGLAIEQIYVDSSESLWGGRRIWGLPKKLATFTWHAGHCHIADAVGTIARLRIEQRPSRLPPLPLAVAGIGVLGDDFAYFRATLTGHMARAGLRIAEWQSRHRYHLRSSPLLAVSARPFQMTVHAPKLITPR